MGIFHSQVHSPFKMAEKTHMSVVICGHVDSGKSTTTGRLLFELGGIPQREMDKLKEEAEKIGKGSFAFAFYMDTQKDVRCGRAACRLVMINWKMGKETGGEKAEGVTALKTNDAAEVIFEPQQPMVVDSFDKCEGLSRIAFMDGNSAVMLGKVCGVNAEKTWK